LDVQYRFDDEVKDDAHGAFTPEMLKLPQATWIETFVEGVTDKSTGLPLFSDLVWFTYKVSGVMCSASVFEHCWREREKKHRENTDFFHFFLKKFNSRQKKIIKKNKNTLAPWVTGLGCLCHPGARVPI
jgi:hypothetical protein